MNAKKVLIVEDDKMLCTIFEMFLKELGHEIIGFSQSGDDAIKISEETKPDIVLMDIHLDGDIDGIETAKIMQDRFDVPVIFISSDIEEDTVKNAIMQNTYGFLVKPVYKTTLGITLEFAISKHQFDYESRKTMV